MAELKGIAFGLSDEIGVEMAADTDVELTEVLLSTEIDKAGN